MKSTVDQIRARFDHEVDRFADLETAQSSTVDAPRILDLIARAAAATNPCATHVLDIGCGAGNYALKLLGLLPRLNVVLVDLSAPMLERAAQRIRPATTGRTTVVQADIRALALGAARFDIIMAAAVFHHLRSDDEWEAVFAKCHAALVPGGSFWISDLIDHETTPVQALMWGHYRAYLTGLRDAPYGEQVFECVEQEDTPRPLLYQIDLLRRVGFRTVEVLHKNSCFAAFGAIK